MSAPSSRSDQNFTFHLPRSSLKIAGIAFGVGILLFLVVWLNARRNNEFYRADPAQPQAETATLTPLPAPLPAGSGASEMPDARPESVEQAPELVETAPAQPPQPIAEAAPAEPAPAPAPAAVAPSDQPVPLPGQSPAPDYPAAALRRGESGTVVVRVDVDANGVPLDVRLVQRSGSRDLDRAAQEAVRNWRFQPAQINGQPMQGSLEIPFDFKPAQ